MDISPSLRRPALKLLRVVIYSAIIVLLCWKVWSVRHGLGPSLRSVGWGAFALAAGCSVIGTFPGFFAWWLLVARSGIRLVFPDAAWIFFMSSLTRYVPGTIWPTVMQGMLAKKAGAPVNRLVAAGLVGVVLTALSGVLVGFLAFPHLVAGDPRWWLMLPVLLGIGAVMLTPRLLGRLVGLGQRLVRQGDQEIALPDGRTSLEVIGLNALGWFCNGIHAAVLAVVLGAPVISAVTLGIGGFTLSSIAGTLSLAPAGIGIREVLLGHTLGVLVHGPDLVTLVLLSRVITILGQLVATAGVLGVLAGLRYLKGRPAEEEPAQAAVDQPVAR